MRIKLAKLKYRREYKHGKINLQNDIADRIIEMAWEDRTPF